MQRFDDSPRSDGDLEPTVRHEVLPPGAWSAIRCTNRTGAVGVLALAVALSAGAGEPGTNATAGSSSATAAAALAPPASIQSQSLKTALAQALREPQVDNRLNRLADVGARLSASEIPEALKAAGSLGELRERMVFKQAALIRWSELAPEDAFT